MNRQMIPYARPQQAMQNFGVQQPMVQQPNMMAQTPYIIVPNPYYQQQMMPNQFMRPVMAQLGDLSNEEAQKILLEHFENLPIATQSKILTEAIQGKFDTMSKEVAVAMEKVCTAGVVEKAKSAVTDNQWILYIILAFLLGFGVFSFFNKKSKGRK